VNRKGFGILLILFSSMLMLPVFPSLSSPETPHAKFMTGSTATMEIVNPLDGTHDFNFTSNNLHVGDTFVINLTVVGVTDLSCFQVSITWDPTLLEYVNFTFPSDYVFAGQEAITAHDFPDPGTVVWGACLIPLPPPLSFNGTGTLAQLALKVIQGVCPAGPQNVTCPLAYSKREEAREDDTFLLNSRTTEIISSRVNGNYRYSLVAGPPLRVPEDYKSVQAATDAAAPGSTITIGPGIYNESVAVNKTLTIIGRLGSEPIFSGGGSGIAITLSAGASGSIVAGIVITSWNEGILIDGASGCKIYNNIISLMSSDGIALQGASAVSNLISKNIFQNSTVAIDLSSSSYNNTVCKNIIRSSNTGINLESSGNLIYTNSIAESKVGIDLSNSNNNIIYHNNFVNNSVQVSISTSAGNIWDNGYPSGGNYWSDYTGPDLYSGPNQNQPGNDSIVDSNYTIAGGNVDRYPLVQPFNAHDVGITDDTLSKTVVGQGYPLRTELKILNYGLYDESFLVTTYANTSEAATQNVAITRINCTIITLTWNTTSFAYGNYTISIYAGPVTGENDAGDNNCTWIVPVHVGVPSDVSSTVPGIYDGKVDMKDIAYLVSLFNTKPGSRNWNPNADVNDDDVVNMKDIATAVAYFNRHE